MSPNETKKRWQLYFSQDSDASLDYGALSEQFFEAEKDVFDNNGNEFMIADIENGRSSRRSVSSEGELDSSLALWSKRGIRIISIPSERTTAPLSISSSMACRLVHEYQVKKEFIRTVLSFGRSPNQAEANSSYADFQGSFGGEYRASYKLNYMEKNQRSGRDPWSSRHVGVYHHHTADFDLFLVLNCTRSTRFIDVLEALTAPAASSAASHNKTLTHLQRNPASLHSLLLSCYLDNWRPYFKSLSSRFSRINNQAMIIPIDQTGQETFEKVQSLRHLYDLALYANACCASNASIVQLLTNDTTSANEDHQRMISFATNLQGSTDSCKVLLEKIRNGIDLVGYTLTIHNQLETTKLDREVRDMTRRMEVLAKEDRDITEQLRNLAEETATVTKNLQELTQHTVDDSAIIHIITIVSAVYLPGSFVSTVFGMNFFNFDAEARRIEVAHDFWLFVVCWVVFMAITAGVFGLTWWLKRKNISLPWSRGHPWRTRV